ncbi:MAG: FAD-binding oxidoreductase [Lachnospiraceae bacterium]|nr:FAD-binding oxidoreductase [Lachnospiraceae bacterium]
MIYDKIIIGAGLYGLYAALFCAKREENVLVLEHDDEPFKRATYINQARVHMGYHYPRSLSTAMKSAGYFERFHDDFGFCINKEFDKVYATSAQMSWTNAEQFQKFCNSAGIHCEGLSPDSYFKEGMCDGAFMTREYTYDAMILKEYYIKELAKFSNVTIQYGARIKHIEKQEDKYVVTMQNDTAYATGFLLNATYASTNQILEMLGFEKFRIKYELCEIILCEVSDKLKDVGITVMDGPFFSIMPFGKTGYHSLTSVTFTPHETSYDYLPSFECQVKSDGYCSSRQLGNCNDCKVKPQTAWDYMSRLARKYLKDEYAFSYKGSLYSMKPILKASEVDDSRPTIVKQFSEDPVFVSVFSGKINTVYDLDEVLTNEK